MAEEGREGTLKRELKFATPASARRTIGRFHGASSLIPGAAWNLVKTDLSGEKFTVRDDVVAPSSLSRIAKWENVVPVVAKLWRPTSVRLKRDAIHAAASPRINRRPISLRRNSSLSLFLSLFFPAGRLLFTEARNNPDVRIPFSPVLFPRCPIKRGRTAQSVVARGTWCFFDELEELITFTCAIKLTAARPNLSN